MVHLDEARAHIGERVVYGASYDRPEIGVITSVSQSYVFVRYGAASTSTATAAVDLELLDQED